MMYLCQSSEKSRNIHDRYDVCMYITYGISTVSCYIPSTGTQFSKVLDFSLLGLGALLNGAHPAAVWTFELPDNWTLKGLTWN